MMPRSVPAEAERRRFFALDATCPLVTKVHREAEIHHRRGREIMLIGHAGHPEVVGTMGQLPEGVVRLIETVADAMAFTPKDASKLAYVTQTTLSVADAAEIVAAIKARFPNIVGPSRAIHAAHAALALEADDLVGTEARARLEDAAKRLNGIADGR